MQQKELATLLDISPAMVSRLVKRGMPADTLERAQRWRKRHLESGRMKGARFAPADTPPKSNHQPERTNPTAAELQVVGALELESVGDLIDHAMERGNNYGAAVRTWQLRGLFRQHGDGLAPCLTLRVWLALLGYMIHSEAEILQASELARLVSPGEVGQLVCPANPWLAHMVVHAACDWDDDALNGWPEDSDDD